MLIVVSGTHASGKSTLISDFALAHPSAVVGGEVFDLVREEDDRVDGRMFANQLHIAAERIHAVPVGQFTILERGPVDFLAYLIAREHISRGNLDATVWERARYITARAMQRVDLLVVLPLSERDNIHVDHDEDPALRTAMDVALLDLIDEGDVIGPGVVLELSGPSEIRNAALRETVARLTG